MAIEEELEQCKKLLTEFQEKPEAQPFLEPVNWKELNLPDYPQVIKRPMDLGTIQATIEGGRYKDAYEFAEEMRLVWNNAKTYNTPGSGIYVVAENLSKQFERKFARIKKSTSNRKIRDDKIQGRESKQEDRVKFTELIKQLSSDQLGVVVETIEKKSPMALNTVDGEENLEIEVYHIDGDTLNELIRYCEQCLKKKRKEKEH